MLLPLFPHQCLGLGTNLLLIVGTVSWDIRGTWMSEQDQSSLLQYPSIRGIPGTTGAAGPLLVLLHLGRQLQRTVIHPGSAFLWKWGSSVGTHWAAATSQVQVSLQPLECAKEWAASSTHQPWCPYKVLHFGGYLTLLNILPSHKDIEVPREDPKSSSSTVRVGKG